MTVKVRTLLATLLLLAGCGDGAAAPTTAHIGSLPDEVGILVGGIRWELPAAVCDSTAGAPQLEAAATATALEVRNLVADRVSGWPTTTRALPGDEAGFFVAINRAGPVALSLATLTGSRESVIADWAQFEAGYTDLPASPGPVSVIADRLQGWSATAAGIVAAIPTACG